MNAPDLRGLEMLFERACALCATRCDLPTPMEICAVEDSDDWGEQLEDVHAVHPRQALPRLHGLGTYGSRMPVG